MRLSSLLAAAGLWLARFSHVIVEAALLVCCHLDPSALGVKCTVCGVQIGFIAQADAVDELRKPRGEATDRIQRLVPAPALLLPPAVHLEAVFDRHGKEYRLQLMGDGSSHLCLEEVWIADRRC